MNPRFGLIASVGLALLLSLDASGANVIVWKLFENRAGRRIQYPADWKTSSCRNCSDTSAPNVFVSFLPASASANDGSVMVSPLRNKPNGTSLGVWFAEVEATANLNPRIREQRFTLNELPAARESLHKF